MITVSSFWPVFRRMISASKQCSVFRRLINDIRVFTVFVLMITVSGCGLLSQAWTLYPGCLLLSNQPHHRSRLGCKLDPANSCASVQCSVWSVASGHRKDQGLIPDQALIFWLLFSPLRLFILPRRSCSFSCYIRSSKYDSFHIFQFMSILPSGILRTHNSLLSSWLD